MTSRINGLHTKSWAHILILVVLAFVTLGAPQRALAADGGGNGGCNVNDPSCTVDVGGGSGSTGSRGGGSHDGGSGGTGGGGTPGCHNTDPASGCDPCPADVPLVRMPDPEACAAWSQNLFCSQLNTNGMNYATLVAFLQSVNCWQNPYRPGSPVVAAHNALASIHFPRPSGERSPSQDQLYEGYAFTYVGLWTFYWTSPKTWTTLMATADDGNQSATVTAKPVELDFDPGDGSAAVSCDGPGRPWTDADGNDAPSAGACGYQYRNVTSGPITSTQTIVWAITWVGTSNSAGQLPSLSTSTSGQLQVMQIQTVVTR
jgi:hypothetical protein